jgi:hypothetical protein
LVELHGASLEILDLRIKIRDASTVGGKRVDHGDCE